MHLYTDGYDVILIAHNIYLKKKEEKTKIKKKHTNMLFILNKINEHFFVFFLLLYKQSSFKLTQSQKARSRYSIIIIIIKQNKLFARK